MVKSNRLALALALLVFIAAELRGATLGHAAQRAGVVLALAWLLQTAWRGILWPWLRTLAEGARRKAEEEMSDMGSQAQEEQEVTETA
ncbi:MAG: hypothetical protein ONB23_06080 [candidate division KSB1 bacterium]|nr:hypothetical protein [candidate division KSB1 bacterium]